MADEIVTIRLRLDKNDLKKSEALVEKEFRKLGSESGKEFGKSFSKGSEKAVKSVDGISKSIFTMKNALLGVAAFFATGFAAKKFINAAAEQEDAINKLNVALSITGKFSESASKDIQAYASTLQSTTRYGDELILKNAALIQSLGNLDKDGLKRATKAAIDMSAALGIDLTAAATLVGKAAAGEIGSFSRYGVIIKKGADNAETFAKALTALEGKFGGTAAQQVDTFSGKFDQLSNNWGDFIENIGFFITQSHAAESSINALNRAVKGLNATFGKKELPLADQLFNATKEMNRLLGSIERVENRSKSFGKVWIDTISGALGGTVEDMKSEANYLKSIISDLNKKIVEEQKINGQKRVIQNKITLDEMLSQLNAFGIKTIGQLKAQKEKGLELLKASNEVKLITAEEYELRKLELITRYDEQIKALSASTSAEINGQWESFNDGFKSMLRQAKTGTANLRGMFSDVGKAAKENLAGAIGGAFSSFGKALVEGDNALKAFTKAFIASIGQAAIATGTKFILEGIAISVNPYLGGPAVGGPIIATGAALAAFGGALSAVGGGGESGGSASAATSGGSTT